MPEPGTADERKLAHARVQFLTAERVDPRDVRDTILASWWRSHRKKVAADHIDLPYVRNPDLELPLARSATPILRRLSEQLDGQAISVILTDPAGVVLERLTGDGDLHRHLDGINLAPGFSYAEEFVGTNGIGTALEGGRPMHVFGHEHYAEDLEDLACAGVPIQHPITGKTVGAVDLTCWRRDAGPLMIALAKTTADQIRQALLVDSGVRELELFQAYLQACRRTTGMVLALNNDVVIMNDPARHLLDPGDQSVLLERASEALAGGHRSPVVVELPTGETARISCRPVERHNQVTGGIVHVSLIRPGDEPAAAPRPRKLLPELAGTAPAWLRCCQEVDSAFGAREWLLLSGEPGTGKLALARAVQHRHHPDRHIPVVDAAAPDPVRHIAAELREHSTVVITHLDRIPDPRPLVELLAGNQETRWVAATHTAAIAPGLAQCFGRTVEVPPLRHHIEDLRELVPLFLARLSHGTGLTCAHEAMQLLTRSTWPGNAAQLHEVLKQIVRNRRRTGVIGPDDLPPDYHAVSRRRLSQLESMERDAIVRSLLANQGNKKRAAEALGMSRATIYRKIHDYGILAPRG
ncbi:GAF domain-containing protein [Amycolatopsis xylanica]|uniref:GAF domain-containing protein n=1 Tax=Amycolatopsis xylanica TaxID=589385 RepID=A0A1H2VKL7_9PSEU|nr:GAF domain-containing protein [Amycolatopsis xylanica]SDW68788.1 GAF domain-containing protein [Amycolatopsis xylanica]